mmetsp:Transcript_28476/g.46759  ORF Transcript_28476/g.46759 Transcript_28476/m.46759 type:complete len:300 (+) Transcript_28476:51-950(+)
MGSLCSPERVETSTHDTPGPRRKLKNGQIENGHHSDVDQSASMTEESQTDTVHASDIEHMNSLSDVENEGKSNPDAHAQPQKAPFQIVVTPAANHNPDQDDTDAPIEDTLSNKKKQKIDTTLGGVVSWKKVADFSALLPRDVKLKLWNGVFKTETDLTQPEIKRLSKLLRTFVMLQLTREYKKRDETVPNEIKQQLQTAVREPAKFIAGLLKKDSAFMEKAFLSIYNSIVDGLHTDDDSKKQKAAKKINVAQENYAELSNETLQSEFNQNDFLKTAFLQYVLYAYQIKLDAEANKKQST